MRSLARIVAVVGSLTLAACVGTVGGAGNGTPDASSGTPDAPAQAGPISVSGKTMDYFDATALPAVAYATDGMSPALTGQSGADGAFQLDNVPPASTFHVSITAPAANYRPTRNDAVFVKDVSVVANQYAVSKVGAQRQYSTLGLAPTTGTAIVIVDLRRNNGTPLEGVALADISLVDAAGAPVPGIKGPYFFGPNGDVVANATLGVSTAYNGKARVAYLDVPHGTWTFKANYLGGTGGGAGGTGGGTGSGTPTIRTMVVPTMTFADGATLASSGHQDDDAVGPTGTNLLFTKDIYPLL